MLPTGLALVSVLALGLAGLYVAVGRRLARRGGADAWPLRLFATFWIGMAAYGALDAAWALGVAWGVVPLALSLAVLHLKILAAVGAFFGLCAYLLYVYTGRRGVVRLLAVAYALVYVTVVYFYVWRGPIDQHLTTWGASLDYARPGGAFQKAVIVMLFVPPALSAVAYALLLRVAPSREARLRVAATSASLAVLFAGLTLGWLNGAWPWWGLAEKLLALAAALGVLWALRAERVTAA